MALNPTWATLALLLSMTTPARANEVCDRIASFEHAGFDPDAQPKGRRWVELHWLGSWMDFQEGWGFGCRSSPDVASRKLCGWLKDHTSYEFATYLPFQLLECHGYRFPRPYPSWGGWNADIDLDIGERWGKLEITFGRFAGEEGAIRLSSFAEKMDDALVELPALGPWSGDGTNGAK